MYSVCLPDGGALLILLPEARVDNWISEQQGQNSEL